MKTILLAGGLGTRLAEETVIKPKPMVEIGGIPILVHIMSIYAAYGYNDFLVAGGYRCVFIKEYYWNYQVKHSDWCINLRSGDCTLYGSRAPAWNVWVIDTGAQTMTGGRVLRLKALVGDEPFMVTSGDGVADIDIAALVRFHCQHGKLATVTAVRPPARFGCLELDGAAVRNFAEKPQVSEGWINGGFFVFEPGVLDYLDGDDCVLEKTPLEKLARESQLMAFQHHGFWQPMDTLRDKQTLEKMWNDGTAPWKLERDNHGRLHGVPESTRPGDRPHRLQGHLARHVA